MDYLILSDSHRKAANIRAALDRQITRPAAVLFLGDGVSDAEDVAGHLPLYAVSGNCDAFLSPAASCPGERLVTLDGLRILMMHGHLCGVKSGPGGAILRAVQSGADILLFGHTHEPYAEQIAEGTLIGTMRTERRLYVFNPGSIAEGSFGSLTVRDGVPFFSHGVL